MSLKERGNKRRYNVTWGLYTQPSYPQALTSGTSTNIASWMSAAAAEPSAVCGGTCTRGLHSSTAQFNLSRVWHNKTPYTPYIPPHTPLIRAG
jgi:hypothetical protein